jgi:hypothetical protein
MKKHNRLLLAGYCNLQGEVNALKEKGGSRGEEVIEIKVKHAELTGAEPFVRTASRTLQGPTATTCGKEGGEEG